MKGFTLSRAKTEYIKFKFNNVRLNEIIIKLGDNELSITKNFKYLESFLQRDGGVERDVFHKIPTG